LRRPIRPRAGTGTRDEDVGTVEMVTLVEIAVDPELDRSVEMGGRSLENARDGRATRRGCFHPPDQQAPTIKSTWQTAEPDLDSGRVHRDARGIWPDPGMS
jgi:hypothetical protein